MVGQGAVRARVTLAKQVMFALGFLPWVVDYQGGGSEGGTLSCRNRGNLMVLKVMLQL